MRLAKRAALASVAATCCLITLMLATGAHTCQHHKPPATSHHLPPQPHPNQILWRPHLSRYRRHTEVKGEPEEEEEEKQDGTLDDRGSSSNNNATNLQVADVLELSPLQAAQHGFFRHSPSISVIITVAYTLVFVIGLVGNSLVVAIVCKSPRMRTVTNYFIANLALADILVLLFCLPATLMSNLFYPYVLGLFVCKTVSYLQGVVVSASIHTMLAVTIDRFLAICFPMDWHMSRRMARLTIACIWLLSLAISFPWFLYFTLAPFALDSHTIQVCSEEWPSEFWGTVYFVCANLILLYLFPLTVIIICYLGIWYKIERRSIPGDRPQGLKIELIMQKSKLKVVKMMMVVVVVFLISWFPLYLITARLKLSDERSQWEDWLINKLMPLAQWLGASNSCINPILYTLFNRKYQHGFMELLRHGCCDWCGRGSGSHRQANSGPKANNKLGSSENQHHPMLANTNGTGSGADGSGASGTGSYCRGQMKQDATNGTSTTESVRMESIHRLGNGRHRQLRSLLASSHEQISTSKVREALSPGARCRSVATLGSASEEPPAPASYRATLSTLDPSIEQVLSSTTTNTESPYSASSGDPGGLHKSGHRKEAYEAPGRGRGSQHIGGAVNRLVAGKGHLINRKSLPYQNKRARSMLPPTSSTKRCSASIEPVKEVEDLILGEHHMKRRRRWHPFTGGGGGQSRKSNSPSVTRDTDSTDVTGSGAGLVS